MLTKAKDLDSLSLPFLLPEDYDQTDAQTFTYALLECVLRIQAKDCGLKTIRLTVEDTKDINVILDVLKEKFKTDATPGEPSRPGNYREVYS